MDIITNKEVFAEDSQNKITRAKPNRQQGRAGRPKKISLPIPENKLAAPSASLDSGSLMQRTSFYQAAKPRNDRPKLVPNNKPRPVFRPKTNPLPHGGNQPLDSHLGQPLNNQAGPNHNPNRVVPGNRPPRHRAVNRPILNGSQTVTSNLGTPDSPTAPLPVRPPLPRAAFSPNLPRADLKLRVIPLGGLEEIGKNMTILEYGQDIILVDMGFLFPDSDMLGVDYIIPDVSYLDDKKERIRGVLITHGHLDHIGAVPYLVERLGFPTMYGSPISMGMVKGRLEEFNLANKCKLVTVESDKDVLQLGAFRVRPFHLVHNIPGATGLEIETPNGRLVYATDWKFDYTPAGNKPVDFRNLAAIGARGVDIYMSDSTNADKPGHCISEKQVEKSLTESVSEARGRIIVAMFSSHLDRIQMAINAAAKNGRKVIVQGRSMQNNIEMAVNLRAMNIPVNTLVSEREINNIDDSKLMILSTGSQGEERSALIRMAKGEHRTIHLKKGDTVFISSSPIPGNERSVSGLMELLYKAGTNVLYNKILDVHASGHAYQEELKLMAALMRPRYFIPLHGERSRRILHGKLVEDTGVDKENILIGENGSVLELDHNGKVTITNETVPAGHVIVDGLGVGDIGAVVLKDRQLMAHEGIFVVISVYDNKKKAFVTSPDIISRGFIYMRDNEKFINDVRAEIKNFLQHSVSGGHKPDFNQVRNELKDNLSKLLYQKTEREPMVIPVIIEV